MDIIAGLLILVGIYLIGEKNRMGFVACVGGNILWMGYAVMSHSAYGIFLSAIPSLILNINCYFKWKKED